MFRPISLQNLIIFIPNGIYNVLFFFVLNSDNKFFISIPNEKDFEVFF